MRIGVLGTGTVGQAIATRLCELQHEVCMGSREAGNEKAAAWAAHHGPSSSTGTFADAAAFGAIVFNCTAGRGSVAAVTSAAPQLAGKVLIDVTNPLDHSGDTTTLFVGNDDSLAESIQRAVPEANVVKTLNTVNNAVMVDPSLVPGDHVMFVSGDDEGAKATATLLLEQFGWPPERVVDLGDLTAARAQEAYLLLWIKLMKPLGGFNFNVAIQQG
ncbi:MAG: NAD(P)-binding domain-containing protein [Solirubrobacteraceae bacterium]|nr:NAD(P)-binding domain-containing protein [Solirubrobacteraceae bacterium]